MHGAYLKSFNFRDSGGNPAGVVLTDSELSDEEMLKMAKENGFSETAFVKENSLTNYDVRFFTPTTEVELCGHATIAAFYYLAYVKLQNKIYLYDEIRQNTKAGSLGVKVNYDGKNVKNILMEQATPQSFGYVSSETKIEIVRSLGISKDELLEELDIEIVSTGLKDIFIAVKNREILNNIEPSLDMITQVSKANDVLGYHVFTVDEGQIYSRNFAPYVGIDEECATGTSNGALGYILNRQGIIGVKTEIFQGEAMGKLSKICVELVAKDANIKVFVGGTAVIIEE